MTYDKSKILNCGSIASSPSNQITMSSEPKAVLHIVQDGTDDLALSIGVADQRANIILNKVERTFYDALVYPYTENRPESVAHILHEVSKVCENMQELCYAMYRAGYQYRVYEEQKESEARKNKMPPFPFLFGRPD